MNWAPQHGTPALARISIESRLREREGERDGYESQFEQLNLYFILYVINIVIIKGRKLLIWALFVFVFIIFITVVVVVIGLLLIMKLEMNKVRNNLLIIFACNGVCLNIKFL